MIASVLFVSSKLVWGLLRPSTLLLLVGLVGLACGIRRRRWARCLVHISLLSYALILLLPIDQAVLLPLEDRFPRPALPDHVDGIIVLGGAVELSRSEARDTPSLNGAAERMTDFVALARRFPDARLAFTGGSGDWIPDVRSEADYARRLFDALGLGTRNVVYENHSRNTYENAVFLKRLLAPKPGETWILVTSAMHMPRSVGIFRQAGWPVLAWPVAYKSAWSFKVGFGESLGVRLTQLDDAVHEWAGLIAYRLLGRSDAVLPDP